MVSAEMPQKLGRYEIVRVLGKGAMGVVYEGRDPNINRRVAIKTARRDIMEASGMADEMMERFLREAQAAGVLNHPNIITIYDAAEQDGVAYIAMEYLEGGDLLDALQRRQSFSMDEIAEVGATICEALAAAHDQGVVHRDVKPANIMMPDHGPLKIADFGIARVSDSNLTQEGALIGTPHYMSPEQFMGQQVDGRSDLFSAAIIIYEMLTGERPFTGEALSTVMHNVVKTAPVIPTELNYAVPDALGHVVMKGLSKRPSERYQDGRSMAAALRESMKTKPNPAILGFTLTPDSEDTVTRPIAAEAATMLSSSAQSIAPPPGGPATVLQSPSVAPVPVAGSDNAPSLFQRLHLSAWLGLVAVLALGIAGILAYLGRPDMPSQPASAVTASNNTAPKKFFSGIRFQLWQASSMPVFAKLSEIEGESSRWAQVEGGDAIEIKTADSLVVTDDKGVELVRLAPYKNEDPIPLDAHPATLSFVVRVGSLDSRATLIAQTSGGPTFLQQLLFPPPETSK